MKIILIAIFCTIFLSRFSFSASDGLKPMKYNFTFNGLLGSIDKNSAQRGLQVFTEICASCHGLDHLAYRNLEEIGYNKSQINNIAKQFLIDDIPDENGEIKKYSLVRSEGIELARPGCSVEVARLWQIYRRLPSRTGTGPPLLR